MWLLIGTSRFSVSCLPQNKRVQKSSSFLLKFRQEDIFPAFCRGRWRIHFETKYLSYLGKQSSRKLYRLKRELLVDRSRLKGYFALMRRALKLEINIQLPSPCVHPIQEAHRESQGINAFIQINVDIKRKVELKKCAFVLSLQRLWLKAI